MARSKWPLIRRVSSAHMFPVRSNYMVWKKLRAHFRLDNGLDKGLDNCLIRGHFGLGRSDQRQFRAHTSLVRDNFERTLVWSGEVLSDQSDVSIALLSDQRTLRPHVYLIRGRFDRTFVWSEDVSRAEIGWILSEKSTVEQANIFLRFSSMFWVCSPLPSLNRAGDRLRRSYKQTTIGDFEKSVR